MTETEKNAFIGTNISKVRVETYITSFNYDQSVKISQDNWIYRAKLTFLTVLLN